MTTPVATFTAFPLTNLVDPVMVVVTDSLSLDGADLALDGLVIKYT